MPDPQELLDFISSVRSLDKDALPVVTAAVGVLKPESKKPFRKLLRSDEPAFVLANAIQSDSFYSEFDSIICPWLFEIHQTATSPEASRFVLNLVPSLLWRYLLYRTPQSDGGDVRHVEAVLLAVYQAEAAARDGRELKWTPPLHAGSIYQPAAVIPPGHQRKPSGAQAALTAESLNQLNKQHSKADRAEVLISEPLPPVTDVDRPLTARQRDSVVEVALQLLTANLAFLPDFVVRSFCAFCAGVSTFGMPLPDPEAEALLTPVDVSRHHEAHHVAGGSSRKLKKKDFTEANITFRFPSDAKRRRLVLSKGAFNELANGLGYAVTRPGSRTFALSALRALQHRATYEVRTELLLATSALKQLAETAVQ